MTFDSRKLLYKRYTDSPSLSEPKRKGLSLVDKVRYGLQEGQFRVAFQPIVGLNTRELAGVEVLLRWQHPEYGSLLPGYFSEALADDVVARKSLDFVLGEACAQLSEWQRCGEPACRLFVNMQPALLMDRALSAAIAETTSRHGIDPSLITLELLETEDVAKMLALRELTRPLKSLGVQLALDDFGTGYSSLAALCALDIDTVKLAQRFVAGLPMSDRAAIVMNSVLSMLDQLNITTIVEGVETPEQAEWLRHRNTYVQGYFIARPQATLAQAICSIQT